MTINGTDNNNVRNNGKKEAIEDYKITIDAINALDENVRDYLEKTNSNKIPYDLIGLYKGMILTNLEHSVNNETMSLNTMKKVEYVLGSVANYCEAHCKKANSQYINASLFNKHLQRAKKELA